MIPLVLVFAKNQQCLVFKLVFGLKVAVLLQSSSVQCNYSSKNRFAILISQFANASVSWLDHGPVGFDMKNGKRIVMTMYYFLIELV